jgi:hypothetical protein
MLPAATAAGLHHSSTVLHGDGPADWSRVEHALCLFGLIAVQGVVHFKELTAASAVAWMRVVQGHGSCGMSYEVNMNTCTPFQPFQGVHFGT